MAAITQPKSALRKLMLNMYLFGVSLLRCMEAKHELYRKIQKKIFGDLRHLKYGC